MVFPEIFDRTIFGRKCLAGNWGDLERGNATITVHGTITGKLFEYKKYKKNVIIRG